MSEVAFLWALAAALAGAKLLGHGFDRLKLPPLLGQILAGVLLAHLPGFWGPVLQSETFASLADLGLLCLLLVTGTESRVADMKRAGAASLLVAVGGVVAPFAAGLAAAQVLGLSTPQALVIGALFTPTSIGVTAVTLLDAHRLRTAVGATLVGAAIVDDILALVVLALVLGTGSLLGIFAKASAFCAAALVIGWKAMPRVYRSYRPAQVPQASLAFVLVAAFALAALAETAGLAAVTGAFVAGLAVRETMGEEKLLERIHTVSYGLFIPLFFLHLGATLDLASLGGLGRFAPILLLASFGGKFLGSAAGALAARMGWVRALQVGIGMLPRMEVSLVILALAIRQGIFPGSLGDVMTGVALLNMTASLLCTPLLLGAAFRLEPAIEPHHPPLDGGVPPP
jgi:Kef-type K+ transport system membrane component KefB